MNASIVGHGIHMRRLSSLLYVAESNAIQWVVPQIVVNNEVIDRLKNFVLNNH